MTKLTLILLTGSLAWGQVATEANQRYQSEESRKGVLQTLGDPGRADRLQAEKLVGSLDLVSGATAVDLGTGAGIMLPYLASAVGPSGKVIAQDIHEDLLDAARKNASEAALSNISFLRGGEEDPNLPPQTADLILAVDSYHHFNYPRRMLAGLRAALKDSGRLAIMDYYKSGFRDPDHIRAEKPEVIKEIEAEGFRLVKEVEHVPDTQYLVIFEKED